MVESDPILRRSNAVQSTIDLFFHHSFSRGNLEGFALLSLHLCLSQVGLSIVRFTPAWFLFVTLINVGPLFLIDVVHPLLIYFQWSRCFRSTHLFLETIDQHQHQQWLMKIHGFESIRPTFLLFEEQLGQLRRHLFRELRRHFLAARALARPFSAGHDQLIYSIDLDIFGLLMSEEIERLRPLTDQFNQASITSMFKLC